MADQASIMRALTVPLFLIGTAVAVIFTVRTSGAMGLVIFPVIMVIAYLLLNPVRIVTLLAPAVAMTVLIPGMPGSLTLAQALTLLLAAWGILNRATDKTSTKETGVSDWALACFLGVMAIVIISRGFGMRVSSGTRYGGFSYITLIGSAMSYYFASYLRLQRKQLVWILIATIIASTAPFLVELSVVLSGGATRTLLSYFAVLPDYTMSASEVGDWGLARISSGRSIGMALLTAAVVFPFRGAARVFIRPSLVAIGIGFAMLSGFRSVLIGVVLIVGWWFWLTSRNRTISFMLVLAGAFLTWGVCVLLGDHLPAAFQRALSFVPGIYVDPIIAANAQASVDWRLEIWRYAWQQLPNYILIGRGLVTDIMPLAWMQREFYASPEFYFAIRGYHSGPLSLLVDFGAPGFIAGSAFFLAVCFEGWSFVRRARLQPVDLVSRYYIFLLVSASVAVFSFYFIAGDVRASLPAFIVDAILLRLIRRHIIENTPAPATATAPAAAAAVPSASGAAAALPAPGLPPMRGPAGSGAVAG